MSRLLVVSQLPPEIGERIAAHRTAPRVVQAPVGQVPEQATEADVLLTGPHPSWPSQGRPAGWPGRLRWVHSVSAGMDWYPDWLLRGPVVTCGRGQNSVAIAEYVMAALLLLEKPLDSVVVRDAAHWHPQVLGRMNGRTLGLAGFGSIGRAVAVRAQAFGMEVVAWRRSAGEIAPGVRRADSLAALAAQSDHLVLALPLTAETRHCLDASVLSAARPGLHLVNIARGGLVDQAALLAALENGRLGFATLDVTDPEPLPDGHPIYRHPRIRLTPHLSWAGGERWSQHVRQILGQLDAFADGFRLADIVDPDLGY